MKPVFLRPLASCLAAVALLALAACATDTPQSTGALDTSSGGPAVGSGSGDLQVVADLQPPPNTNNGVNQPIAPNDVLNIAIFGVPTLSGNVTIDTSGNANLALVGAVQAAGLTVPQFQAKITHLYGSKYLQKPNIIVTTTSARGQQITLDGQFKRTGVFPTDGNTTLLQVTASAGGLTDVGDEDKVFIFRDMGDHREVAQYSIAKIRVGGRPDVRIYGGDVIVDFASGTAVAVQNLKQAFGLAASAMPFRGFIP